MSPMPMENTLLTLRTVPASETSQKFRSLETCTLGTRSYPGAASAIAVAVTVLFLVLAMGWSINPILY